MESKLDAVWRRVSKAASSLTGLSPVILCKPGIGRHSFSREPGRRGTPVAKEIEGEWKGEYQIFGTPRHVTLKLANDGQNGATAEFVVVGKKVNNLPVDVVTQEGDLITVDSHQTGISYEGRFNKEANEIKGTFFQGPIELSLVLHKSK